MPGQDLAGIRMIVTAGPTRESIDPVRYISNHSSGKMGYAVARAAHERGADVLLISGPVGIECPEGVKLVSTATAEEMCKAVLDNFGNCDVVVMAAAVADYRPAEVSETKIKKNDDEMVLRLVRTPDILKKLGTIKGNRILVGFSAETDHLTDNAMKKLESKNLDMIVANDVTMEGAGFGTDTNIIKIIKRDGTVIDLPLMSKLEAAHRILDEVRGLAAGREHGRGGA